MSNDIKIKEKVIQIFDDYFRDAEEEYGINLEKIKYLKDKIKKEVDEILLD